MNPMRNQRGVVVEWLLKIVIFIAVAGVVLFDTGSIVVNRLSAQATAEDVATVAANEVAFAETDINPIDLEEAVEAEAEKRDVKVLKFDYDPEEGILSVRIRKKALTIVAGRFDVFKDWIRATGEATASTKPST
jgi:hypothetical protein